MKKFWIKYREAASYLFFGGVTTVVNWGVYTVCIKALHLGLDLSNGLGWFFAVTVAYITNRLYVFRSKQTTLRGNLKEMLLFFGSRIFTGAFETFLPKKLYSLGLNQSFLWIEGSAAKLAVTVLVIVLNYILSKCLIFKK